MTTSRQKKILLQGLEVCNNNELSGGVKSRIHFNLCSLYQSLHNEEEALEHNRKDIQICRESNLTLDLAKAYLELGNIFLYSLKDDKADDFDAAEKAYKKALRIAESLEDENELQYICSSNLEVLEDAKKLWSEFEILQGEQKAFKRRWEAAAREKDLRESRNMLKMYAKILYQRADLAYLMKSWKKMAELSRLLMEAAVELNDASLRDFACLNIAQAYLELREFSMARRYFMKGFESCTNANDTEGRSVCKAGLGTIEDHLGNSNKALELYEEALQIAQEKGVDKNCLLQLKVAENIHYICLVRMSCKKRTLEAERQIDSIKANLENERRVSLNQNPTVQVNSDSETQFDYHPKEEQPEVGTILSEFQDGRDLPSTRMASLSRGRLMIQNARYKEHELGSIRSGGHDSAHSQSPPGIIIEESEKSLEDSEEPVQPPVKRKLQRKGRIVDSDEDAEEEEQSNMPDAGINSPQEKQDNSALLPSKQTPGIKIEDTSNKENFPPNADQPSFTADDRSHEAKKRRSGPGNLSGIDAPLSNDREQFLHSATAGARADSTDKAIPTSDHQSDQRMASEESNEACSRLFESFCLRMENTLKSQFGAFSESMESTLRTQLGALSERMEELERRFRSMEDKIIGETNSQ